MNNFENIAKQFQQNLNKTLKDFPPETREVFKDFLSNPSSFFSQEKTDSETDSSKVDTDSKLTVYEGKLYRIVDFVTLSNGKIVAAILASITDRNSTNIKISYEEAIKNLVSYTLS